MLPLSDYITLTFTGSDTQKFLQGQVTIDLMNMAPNTASFAAHCNAQGRILANFILCFHHSADCRLLVPSVTAEALQKALQTYAIFSKTHCEYQKLSIVAMQTSEAIQSPSIVSYTLSYPTLTLAIGDKIPTTTFDWPRCLVDHGVVVIDEKTSGHYTPHAIGFDLFGGVNFKKGCYTGQEIIARMHFRGHMKDGLYKARCDHIPTFTTGLSITTLDKAPVGSILSIAPTEDHDDLLINLRHQAVNEDLFIIEGSARTPLSQITPIRSTLNH